jgi:prophage maintenance system killer protein
MANALFATLIMNHPFVDGYKRVAFFATDVFLRMNVYKLQVDTPLLVASNSDPSCALNTDPQKISQYRTKAVLAHTNGADI